MGNIAEGLHVKQAPQKPEPAAPKQAAVPERVLRIADPDHSLSLAAFTLRELDTLKRVCRDADNELGLKALAAGLARAEK